MAWRKTCLVRDALNAQRGTTGKDVGDEAHIVSAVGSTGDRRRHPFGALLVPGVEAGAMKPERALRADEIRLVLNLGRGDRQIAGVARIAVAITGPYLRGPGDGKPPLGDLRSDGRGEIAAVDIRGSADAWMTAQDQFEAASAQGTGLSDDSGQVSMEGSALVDQRDEITTGLLRHDAPPPLFRGLEPSTWRGHPVSVTVRMASSACAGRMPLAASRPLASGAARILRLPWLPPWRGVHQMADEPILREKARAVIQSGKLPSRAPDRTWGGPGVGARCEICGVPVTSDEMEFEIQFARDGDNPGLDKFHVHIRCFAAWEFERGKVPG